MRAAWRAVAVGTGISLAALGCGTGVTVVSLVSPTISTVSPQVVTAGTPTVTLTVKGANFSAQSAVTFNGTTVPTSMVDSATLAAQVSGSALAQPTVAPLQVRNSDGVKSNAVNVTIQGSGVTNSPNSPTPVTISTSTLPAGQAGAAYSGTMSAGGGTPGYTWTVTSGSLPAGLTMSNAGAITGTPTTGGTSSFTVQVTDSGSPALTQTATLSIAVAVAPVTTSPLSIGLTTLANGQVGFNYSATLSASGGTPGYTWTLASGGLPAGLTLSSGGVISGTPTAGGTASFSVQVADSGSPVQTQKTSATITVAASKLTITSSTLSGGQVGSGYGATLSASGGTPGYTWTLASGGLPAGLTLSNGGVISGTPTGTGTANFSVQVADSGSPTQTATLGVSIAVAASKLTMTSSGLGSGQEGTGYSATLSASGGTPGYTWTLASGGLPAGLTLSNGGVISGTPTGTGTANFSVQVADSGSPTQTATTGMSIVISSNVLTITTTGLAGGENGTAYTASLSASGGTPGYTWTVASGSLPAGLTLSNGGVISGTPTVTGPANFTVQVADNGSPTQKATMNASINVAAAPPPPSSGGTTWYARPDGGTRYSANQTSGQCDGKTDAAYSGTGVNQHCAFSDVRYFWTDGSYCVDSTPSSTCWGWIGSGGDTYLIRGSIAEGVTYRIGQNGPNSNDYFGLAGNPYGAGVPPPLSGTASQHTKILGENYANCSAQSARTQLHGGYGVDSILNMASVSYVDVACLDITDFSSCGRVGQTHGCNTGFPLDDYATNGVRWNNTSTYDSLTDVRVHGVSSTGMIGATGTGVVMTDLALIGNAGAGWNSDDGSGTTGSGTLLVQNYNISWNGCSEEYPIVDALPYQDCTDDNDGGYGDGFGSATVASNPAWTVHFDQGVVTYNTQDGLDALHLTGSGSSVAVTRTLAYGNMGQQIKVGGASGTAINNVIVTNCNAMRQAIPGTPSGYNSRLSDFCRAADTGVVFKVGAKTTLTIDFNTIYSASATTYEIDCDGSNGPCDATSLVDFRNNVFVGFLNSTANGYPSWWPVTNDYANPIYLGATDVNGNTLNPFTNPGSLYSNNLTFHAKSNWTCPRAGESNAICSDPQLTDETWNPYSFGSMIPQATTDVVRGAGVAIPSVTVDYTGATRGTPPSIGAYE